MPLDELLYNTRSILATGRFAGLAFHGIGNDARCPLLVPEEVALASVEAARGVIKIPHIGFDDAYECAEQFIRMLADSLEIKTIVFVPTLFKGKRAKWVKFKTCNLSVMPVETLIALSNVGVEIGWHGHSHRRFTDLTFDELNAELKAGADAFEGIRSRIRSCSFPYGIFTQEVMSKLSQQFSRFYQTCLEQNSSLYQNVYYLLDVGTIFHFKDSKIKERKNDPGSSR